MTNWVPGWNHVVAVHGSRGAGQDRAAVVTVDDGVVIALADGAGGTGRGGAAAQAVVDAVVAAASSRPAWHELLAGLDAQPRGLGQGETTAVAVAIGNGVITGASVGDSGAWCIGDGIDELSMDQRRKPLLGSGAAMVVPLRPRAIGGDTLLVASDGLLAYAPRAEIARIACGDDLASAAAALVELVRLPSGGLPDDVSIVLCRATRAPGQ